MERFARTLLRHGWAVIGAWAVVVVLGALAWRALPIDAFPDVTNVQVMVLTSADGLSAVDVEQRVTYPIEQQMGGLPRLAQVRSLSRGGLSQVVVVFEDGVDPYFARQLVFERLAASRELLPAGIEPELAPLSTGLGEIFQYTVEAEGLSLMERRAIQDWLIAPRLRAVQGVTEVNSLGGEVAQIQVVVDPERLLGYGLTLRDVVSAVERGNGVAGAGYILKGWEQTVVRGVGLARNADDIERIVLRAERGVPVLLRDVAEVRLAGSPMRQGAVTRDGAGETVAGMAIMLRGENSRTVVDGVKRAVASIGQALPPGARIDVFYDRTALIEACIETVTDALLEGGILVVLVLFLFVAEVRSALIVVLSLPVTFLFTFVLMRADGMSANLMTLGGLAFSVGMVVDGAIVVAESVRRHLAERGERARREAVVAGLVEVARPVAFSVLVIALVLVPLLTLQGLEGRMFRPLALTLLVSLLTSILVALTLVPVVAEKLLGDRGEREFAFVRRFREGYLRLLRAALPRPRATLAAALAVLAAGAALVPMLGTDFLPPLDEGAIAINVVRLPSASLEGSLAVSTLLERRIRAFPEVAAVVSKTGRAEISEDPMGPEQTDVFVMLKDRRQWGTGRSKAELVEAIGAEIASIPGIRPAFSQPIALRVNELISGVKGDLAVKIFGPDLDVLRSLGERAAAAVSRVAGAADVKLEQIAGMPELEVVLDRDALARYGLAVADVNELLEAAYAGRVASTLIDGERRLDVVVRFPDSARADAEALAGVLVTAPGGERVPLAQLASIRPVEAPAQVSREAGMRRVVVEANVRDRDLGSFVAEAQAALAPLADELPAGYFIEYGGQFENQRRAMSQLAIVVPIALLLVWLLLVAALGRARHAALVLANLPFALVGGVAAAVAFGMPLSVSAAVAFIALLGIAVQNGVVLTAFLGQLRQAGVGLDEAVVRACDVRFKPLFMTALTSFIGHLPMVWAMGSGADIQKPLAVIVMGGIVTSTLLTLIVLPVLYRALEARREPPVPVPERIRA